MEGDWLWKPANFKGLNKRGCQEVEGTSHVTTKVHTQNKMADSADEIFEWGDNFETILDILEKDEEIKEQFT